MLKHYTEFSFYKLKKGEFFNFDFYLLKLFFLFFSCIYEIVIASEYYYSQVFDTRPNIRVESTRNLRIVYVNSIVLVINNILFV